MPKTWPRPPCGAKTARLCWVFQPQAKAPNNDTKPHHWTNFSRGDGLVPAIAQDAQTGEVLMMAYMNAESYAETLASGRAVYYSRSRKKLWRKGEESGNVQLVAPIYVDCDQDTILLSVEQLARACHEGYKSCFFRKVGPNGLTVIGQHSFDPAKFTERSKP